MDWAGDPSKFSNLFFNCGSTHIISANIQCGGLCEDVVDPSDGISKAQHCCLYLNAKNSKGEIVENYWTCAIPAPPVVAVDPQNPEVVKPSSRLCK